MSPTVRRGCASFAAITLLVALASPAAASPETLKRSMSNIIGGPIDMALSPVTSANSVYRNLTTIDDAASVKYIYALPGYVWNIGLSLGAGAVRSFAGLLEFLPGLVLLPFDTDMDPIFAPGEKGSALLDYDTPVLNVKWGIYYGDTPE